MIAQLPHNFLLRLVVLLAVCVGGVAAQPGRAAEPTGGAPLSRGAPARLMPKYSLQGDVIEDPVAIAAERKQFTASYEQFRAAAQEYQKEVKEFISREVATRQKALSAGYQSQIDKLDQEQYDLRKEAIARLESFIFRHRDHETYTPDALFRLAEMYYEDTIASYNRATDNFSRDMDLYNRGKLLDPPTDAKRDFSRSIAIYKYLHWVPEGTTMEPLSGKLAGIVLEKRWPNHKQSDAAMYLQGYCEYEMRDIDPKYEQRALQTLATLEDHYPKSRFVTEAWLRVGEINFDDNEYEKAANAYLRAATKAKEFGDNANYSLALYKLGWSMFQLYRYSEAVKYFQQLIEFEDEVAAAEKNAAPEKNADGTPKKKKAGFDLRKEAIEYLAKSLAEPSWDDDSCDDFGSETTKGECAIVDPRVRPILYTASVLEPTIDPALAKWMAPFGGDVAANIQKNLQARNDVRKSLINGKPYVYDILKMYGETLYNQKEDDYYWQAVRVFNFVVDNYTMSREAQELQRKVINSLDLLAKAGIGYEAELEKNPRSDSARIGLEMANYAKGQQIVARQRYLKLFGKQSEWYAKYGGDKDLAAQVDQTTSQIRFEFAQLNHAEAVRLRRAGKLDEAIVKYAEAGAAYEDLLKADPESPDAYAIAWRLADLWFWAGVQCTAARDKDGELIVVEGEVAPAPVEKLDTLKKSCTSMQKSIQYFNAVRDWKGPRSRDDSGKPMEKTEEAAWSSIDAAERVLSAKASYPATDPEHIDSRSLPSILPSAKQDEADAKAVENLKDVKKVTRIPVDPVAVEWLLAADGYSGIAEKFVNKDDPKRPEKLALKAAQLLYKNRHFDPWPEGATPRTPAEFWSARMRYYAILKRYPGTAVAEAAVKDLLTACGLERDMACLESTAEKTGDALPKDKRESIGKEIKQFKLGQKSDQAYATFKDAEDATKEAEGLASNPEEAGKKFEVARAKYDEAGDRFRGVRKDAEDVEVQRGVLLNAVRAYYRAEQWDKCVDTLTEAEKMLRDAKPADAKKKEEITKGLEEVLQIRAEINFKFFKITETINDFVLLYENNPNGPNADRYLKDAAQTAFYNGNWDKAVELNRVIINRYDKSADIKKAQAVKDAMWQIQTIYKSKGDVAKQIEALEAYITKYASEKTSSAKVFKAYSMIAEIYENRSDKNNAVKMYNRIIDAFTKGGFEKNGGPEATAAAMSTFQLMKPRYDSFLATKLVENTKLAANKRMPDLQNQIKKMMDVLLGPDVKFKAPDGSQAQLRCGQCPPGSAQCRAAVCKPEVNANGMFDEYSQSVMTYGSQNWSYAAMVMRSRMLKHFARTIYDAPRPANMSEEEIEVYEDELEKLGSQFENMAIKGLKAALDDADAKGVVNTWVTELRSEMNKYKPKEYPLLRDEKAAEANPIGTLPLADKELR